MSKWKCKECGEMVLTWRGEPEECPTCQGEMVERPWDFEESGDRYSFWRYNPLRRWWRGQSWGPFGKRGRR